MSSLEEFAEALLEELERERVRVGKAKELLERLGPDVMVPEMQIKGRRVIGIGIKGKVAYVVEPNGMEEEIKRVFRVEKVIEL